MKNKKNKKNKETSNDREEGVIRHSVESSCKQEEVQEVELGDLGYRGPPVYKP